MERWKHRILCTIVLLVLFSATQAKREKKKKANQVAMDGAAGRLQDMVGLLKSKGLIDDEAVNNLQELAMEVNNELEKNKAHNIKADELKSRYEEKMKEMQKTHAEMLEFQKSMPEDIQQSTIQLANAQSRIEELEQEAKEWASQQQTLAMDLKKAYDMHKEDRGNARVLEKIIDEREREMTRLNEEVTGAKARFDELHDHAKRIDEIQVENAASGIQAALLQKDERIDFLKNHNIHLIEHQNKQIKTFLDWIADLEKDNARLTQKGPNRKDVINLQDQVEFLKKDLEETKTALARKEELYEEAQEMKNNLVHSVTSWNKKYADCVRDSGKMKKEFEKQIEEFKMAANGDTTVAAVQSKEAEIVRLQEELAHAADRYSSLEQHVIRIDALEVDKTANRVKRAVKQKDERIEFLNAESEKQNEFYKTQTDKYHAKLDSLEKDNFRLMQHGPSKSDITSLQERLEFCSEDLRHRKGTLSELEVVYEKCLTSRRSLTHQLDQWKDNYTACMKDKKECYDRLKEQDSEPQPDMYKGSSVEELEEKIAQQENEIASLKESKEDTIALRQELNKQNEIIQYLREYNDPTECSKVRVAQQKNLDRMAQENMKWANCNVKLKKLRAKYDQLLNETSSQSNSSSSSDLGNQVDELKAEILTMLNQIQQVNEEKRTVQKNYDHVIKSSEIKAKKMRAENDHIRKELEKAKQAGLEKDTTIVINVGKVKHYTEVSSKLQEEKKELEEKLEATKHIQEELEKAKQESEEKDRQVDRAQAKVEFLKSSNTKLIESTNRLQEELNEANEKIESAKETETPSASSDCSEQNEKVTKLEASITKKDELITYLRNYNDPTGCAADRVTMQKNLDRMAQENMKWANCNVRKKKLQTKVETLEKEVSDLEAKNKEFDSKVKECHEQLDSKPVAETCDNSGDGSDIAALKADIAKKDELITYLRNYNDPTGCAADRVTMQKNLDRMAQENMKWANCNVRKKKLEAKLEKCESNAKSSESNTQPQECTEAEEKYKQCRVDLAAAKNYKGEVDMENDRLRHEVLKWKKLNDKAREESLEGLDPEEKSQVVFLQTKQDILNEKVSYQMKTIKDQTIKIQEKVMEIKTMNKTLNQALDECQCTRQGEGENLKFIPETTIETQGSPSSNSDCDEKLKLMEDDRDKYKADFIQFSGQFTECKMEKHEHVGQSLHFKKALEKCREKVADLTNECKCETVTEIECDESMRYEAMQDRALNCENTLTIWKEKAEKSTTLHAAASKNYTELRTECSAYYHELQQCNTEKGELEFIKNGQEMVLKRIDEDHAKKTEGLEKRSDEAVKNEAVYRNYFFGFGLGFAVLAAKEIYLFLKRRFSEHEEKAKQAKAAIKTNKDSKKKR